MLQSQVINPKVRFLCGGYILWTYLMGSTT